MKYSIFACNDRLDLFGSAVYVGTFYGELSAITGQLDRGGLNFTLGGANCVYAYR